MKRIKLDHRNNVLITKAFENYQHNNELKNLSPVTIKANKDKFKKFMKFLNNEKFLIEDININIVNDYIFSLKKEDIKISSVNIYLKYLRIFLYWCMNNSYCTKFDIKLLKENEEIKTGYTEEQLRILLKKPDTKICTFAEYRNWVIVNFLLSTGIRRNTLANIKIEDLDLENDLIKLTTTKNRKQQLIPISSAIKCILLEYLEYRNGEKEDILFCSSTGTKLTPEGFNKAIREYNYKRGIEDTGLHKFRRTFATMAIKNGIDVFKLQKLLSHKSIKTTQKYVALTISDLQENYDIFNPLDNFIKDNNKNHITLKKN